jgi:hypothetical protein
VAGDRAFYVELLNAPAKRAQLRRSAGGRELLLPVSTADLPIELHYAIIW